MRGIIFLIITAVLLPIASASELLYEIKLDVSDGIELSEVRLIEGEMPVQLSEYAENYEAKTLSFKGEELEIVNFTISDFAYDSPEPIKASTKYIILRYFVNGRAVKLYDPDGKEILEVDVSQFSRCNEDGICDFNENVKGCPGDCTEAEMAARAKDEEAIVAEEAREREKLPAEQYWPYILILAIAIIIAAAIIIKARKK